VTQNRTDFALALANAGYNDNTTCVDTCGSGKGVEFFKTTNGTYYINQFICWSDKLIVGFVLIVLGLIL
jgi:hypothetical protein